MAMPANLHVWAFEWSVAGACKSAELRPTIQLDHLDEGCRIIGAQLRPHGTQQLQKHAQLKLARGAGRHVALVRFQDHAAHELVDERTMHGAEVVQMGEEKGGITARVVLQSWKGAGRLRAHARCRPLPVFRLGQYVPRGHVQGTLRTRGNARAVNRSSSKRSTSASTKSAVTWGPTASETARTMAALMSASDASACSSEMHEPSTDRTSSSTISRWRPEFRSSASWAAILARLPSLNRLSRPRNCRLRAASAVSAPRRAGGTYRLASPASAAARTASPAAAPPSALSSRPSPGSRPSKRAISVSLPLPESEPSGSANSPSSASDSSEPI
eukprot:scaffold14375_cov133-Isochrysis_galbana.AAC.3